MWILGEEITESLPGGCWISIEFPAHFLREDLEQVQILLNAFPVLNRRYVEQRAGAKTCAGLMALPSGPGEEFLEPEYIGDAQGNRYLPEETAGRPGPGVYSLEPVRKKEIHDTRLHDYLELFSDVLARERATFPGIDIDKITQVQRAVAALWTDDGKKADLNILNAYAQVARLRVNLREDTHTLNVEYWTTLGETANGLPAGTGLMASQVTALNKSDTTLVTPVTGGRSFYDPLSLQAINRFT